MWDSGTPNQNGISLLAFIEENDSSLQNTSKPTRMIFNAKLKCSLIDLTITSPSISSKCSLEMTNIFMGSNHCVIDTKININVSHSSQHLPRWAFKRASWDAFYHLCDLDINHSLISADVHDFHNNITSTIMDIAKRTIPTTKPFSKVTVPWWSKACEIAINNKKHAFNRMKRTRDPLDIVIFKRARAKVKLTLNEAKNRFGRITALRFPQTPNWVKFGQY